MKLFFRFSVVSLPESGKIEKSERTRSNGRSPFQRVPLLSIWQTGEYYCGHGIPEWLDRIFAETFSIFAGRNCANVIMLKFPSSRSSFITFGSVFILRNEPRPAPFVTDRTRSIRASAFRGRSAGARTSLEERLIIIRRSSIEQCLDGPASLSRCDPRSSIAAETT